MNSSNVKGSCGCSLFGGCVGGGDLA